MKLPSKPELLFSAKCFAASMLALYVSYTLGLPRPFWAMMTTYVVAQPFSGAVRSKALYRAGGTLLGSTFTMLIVPQLINSPELLSLALALWVAGCLYISLLDRTPRAYLFMLAGYTSALIGFPAVTEPAAIFDIALARVEEILIGISCATLIHSLVFPQSLAPVLMARLDRAIGDAQHWIRDALAGRANANDRRTLASDITDLRLMSTHLPFDTSNLRWTASAIRALQDRLSMLVPLLSAINDRIQALRELGTSLSPQWQALLADLDDWSHGGERNTAERAAQLRSRIDELMPQISQDASWTTVLTLNLAARLRILVDTGEECGQLRRHIAASFRGEPPPPIRFAPGLPNRVLHRDHRLALLSSFAAVIAILLCCAAWIVTAWPAGSAMAMMAAVFCSFFATQDDPVPAIKTFLKYTVYSVPVSAFYVLAVMPAVHSFEMFVLACAPLFLLVGVAIARPASVVPAMAVVLGVGGNLALQDTNSADMVSFINGMLGQIMGIVVAALCTRFFRSVNAGWVARRLLHTGWGELADLSRERKPLPTAAFSARMLDRVGLLTPRLSLAGREEDLVAVDALSDLRVGLNMSQLQNARAHLDREGVFLQPLLDGLGKRFSDLQTRRLPAMAPLLETLDRTLQAVCGARPGAEQRQVVAALAGIRRELFPQAAPYRSAFPTASQGGLP